MSSAFYINKNEGAAHYEGEVHQHFQGNQEAAVYFWVAIKEKGKKKHREEKRWIILYWKHSSCLEFLVSSFRRLFFFSWHSIFPLSIRNSKAYLNTIKQVIGSFLTLKNVCFGPRFVAKPGTVFILYKLFGRIPEERIMQITIFSMAIW